MKREKREGRRKNRKEEKNKKETTSPAFHIAFVEFAICTLGVSVRLDQPAFEVTSEVEEVGQQPSEPMCVHVCSHVFTLFNRAGRHI